MDIDEDGNPIEAVGTQNDARLKMFEQIADSADDVRLTAGDLTDPVDKGVDDGIDPEEQVSQPIDPVKHKIKINGQEREFTTEELMATAAKVAAADEYLAQAKRAFEANLNNPQPSKDVEAVEEDDEALARAIQMGTEEEAAEAIKKLRAKPSLDVRTVVNQVQDSLRFQEAGERVKKEFPDIFADEDLRSLMFQRDKALMDAGDTRSYWERYEAIGNELRSKFKTGTTAKEQRKSATIINMPTASARTASSIVDEPEESPSDTVRQMAKARGQNI